MIENTPQAQNPTNLEAAETNRNRLPLEGILVLDLSRVLAGPYCTLLLAELGARVIKVEPPDRGDDARHYGPFLGGKSVYFTSINRGKESIALNLKRGADHAVFQSLAKKADVLIENFRPGPMQRLGLGPEAMSKLNPRTRGRDRGSP